MVPDLRKSGTIRVLGYARGPKCAQIGDHTSPRNHEGVRPPICASLVEIQVGKNKAQRKHTFATIARTPTAHLAWCVPCHDMRHMCIIVVAPADSMLNLFEVTKVPCHSPKCFLADAPSNLADGEDPYRQPT